MPNTKGSGRSRQLTKALATCAVLLALAGPASAGVISGTNTFTGGSLINPNAWNDAANWSNRAPSPADAPQRSQTERRPLSSMACSSAIVFPSE